MFSDLILFALVGAKREAVPYHLFDDIKSNLFCIFYKNKLHLHTDRERSIYIHTDTHKASDFVFLNIGAKVFYVYSCVVICPSLSESSDLLKDQKRNVKFTLVLMLIQMWYWLGGCHCDTSRTLNWWRYELFRSGNLFCWKGCCCWCCWIWYWFVFSTENEAIKKSMLDRVSNGLSYEFTLLLKFEAPWFRVPRNHHKNRSEFGAAACQFLFWWNFFSWNVRISCKRNAVPIEKVWFFRNLWEKASDALLPYSVLLISNVLKIIWIYELDETFRIK